MDPEEPRYDTNLAELKTEKAFNTYFATNAEIGYYDGHEYWKCTGFVAAGNRERLYSFMKKCWAHSVKKSTIMMLSKGQ